MYSANEIEKRIEEERIKKINLQWEKIEKANEEMYDEGKKSAIFLLEIGENIFNEIIHKLDKLGLQIKKLSTDGSFDKYELSINVDRNKE